MIDPHPLMPIHVLHATNQDPPACGTPLNKGGRGDQCKVCATNLFQIGIKPWLGLVAIASLMLPSPSAQASEMGLARSRDARVLAQTVQSNPQATSQQSFWRRRPKRPSTIRGVICVISPGLIGSLDIWSDRPLFIWQGEGSQIRVRDYTQRDKVLWEKAITNQLPLRYEGQETLQPGQLYQWQVVPADAATSNRPARQRTWETFRILPADRRQEIAIALQTLEQRLQQQNASAEEIALSKAEFFVDRDLWSDALQVIYEVKNPSTKFLEQRSAYVGGLCKASTP